MIHSIINIHTITSPNSIMNTDPPTDIAKTVITNRIAAIISNVINSIISITPFIKGVEFFAKKKRA